MLNALIRANGTAGEDNEGGLLAALQHGSRPVAQDGASPNSGTVSYEMFVEVALRHLRQLRRAAQRLTQVPADADDLVQESYQLALQHYHELRSVAHCRAWLYRILRRQAATRYRRQHSGPALVLFGDDSDAALPEAGVDPSEHMSLREIHDAIDALPAELRIAVMLRDIDGYSYAEIARLTDCPAGTVRSRIARARAKLMITLRTHAENCGIRHAAH